MPSFKSSVDKNSLGAKRKSVPHAFVVEALAALSPEVRRMFSGFAVYIGDKIVCMLRDNQKSPEDNGVWLVFAEESGPTDAAVRREFPSMRPIRFLGGKVRHWSLLPADSEDFESAALHACDLLLAHDPRLGRVPESRKAKAPKKRKA